jgi:hypothetical protein
MPAVNKYKHLPDRFLATHHQISVSPQRVNARLRAVAKSADIASPEHTRGGDEQKW